MQKEIVFDADGFNIYGMLHLPEKKNAPTVIGSHGLLSSGDSPKQIALAEACNSKGIAYFRFDHRGCGKSSGQFSSATAFEGRRKDLVRAIETILDHTDTGHQIALFGSSYGGAVSLSVFPQFHPSSIITVAAPVRLDSIKPPYVNDPENLNRLYSLNRDKLSFDISNILFGVSNILIFHGDGDEVVPFSNAEEIYQKTAEPKELIRPEKGDHPMSNEQLQLDFIHRSVKWYQNVFHLSNKA